VHILPVLTISAGAVLCHVKDSTTQPYRMAMFFTQLPGILHRRWFVPMNEGPFVQIPTRALGHLSAELQLILL